jgi:hypothetical protein
MIHLDLKRTYRIYRIQRWRVNIFAAIIRIAYWGSVFRRIHIYISIYGSTAVLWTFVAFSVS